MIPTLMTPWYVVQKFILGELIFYQDPAENEETFGNAKHAFVFTNRQSAARVAKDNGGHIRMLISKDDTKEFGLD